MRLFRRLFNDEVDQIMKLTRENEYLKSEAKNLMMLVFYEIQRRGTEYGKKWEYTTTPCHKKNSFDYVVLQIRELLEENKKLIDNTQIV